MLVGNSQNTFRSNKREWIHWRFLVFFSHSFSFYLHIQRHRNNIHLFIISIALSNLISTKGKYFKMIWIENRELFFIHWFSNERKLRGRYHRHRGKVRNSKVRGLRDASHPNADSRLRQSLAFQRNHMNFIASNASTQPWCYDWLVMTMTMYA